MEDFRRQEGRAGMSEEIDDHVPGFGKRFDEWFDGVDRDLREVRMAVVDRVRAWDAHDHRKRVGCCRPTRFPLETFRLHRNAH